MFDAAVTRMEKKMGLNRRDFEDLLKRLEVSLRQVDGYADPGASAHTRGIVHTLLDLHGYALERLFKLVEATGAAGKAALEACRRDDTVSGLLLLHGLHPMDYEARVRQALDDVRPVLYERGSSVDLMHADAGVVRLRLNGSFNSCPSSVNMQQSIEEAIFADAPETTRIEVEYNQSPVANEPASPQPIGPKRAGLPVLMS